MTDGDPDADSGIYRRSKEEFIDCLKYRQGVKDVHIYNARAVGGGKPSHKIETLYVGTEVQTSISVLFLTHPLIFDIHVLF